MDYFHGILAYKQNTDISHFHLIFVTNYLYYDLELYLKV